VTVLLLGVNHETAPVAIREQLAISADQIPEVLVQLGGDVGEIAIISTCNRTEFYATDPERTAPVLDAFFHAMSGAEEGSLSGALYVREGRAAVEHLMEVACGLDSMILGEPQILGQVRDAWKSAREAGTLGPVLDAMFRAALNVGKEARSTTAISRGAVSVSHAAVEFARERFGGLAGHSILVIGAGDTGALVARNLRSHGAGQIMIANRGFERSEELAGMLGVHAVRFERLVQSLSVADIVISCTGAPNAVVSRDMLEQALKRRQERTLLAIDIAMPRDIEPEASGLTGLSLHDLDDLHSRIAINDDVRREAAASVAGMVERHVAEFQSWEAGHQAGATIRALRDQAEAVRVKELERSLRRMPDLTDRERETIDILTKSIVNKLLHHPIVEMRDADHGLTNTASARRLFGLHEAPAQVGEIVQVDPVDQRRAAD
jgi:glutamyl-tRNA reductase